MALQPGAKAGTDDLSEDHLKWLVRSRSENQDVTLHLYLAIRNNEIDLGNNLVYTYLAAELAAIAFSLWRAVFLSDVEERGLLGDAQDFLAKLISHNTIGYQQDRNSRGWTFYYYLSDAEQRLDKIAREQPIFLDGTYMDEMPDSLKDRWSIAQKALRTAVVNFQEKTKPPS